MITKSNQALTSSLIKDKFKTFVYDYFRFPLFILSHPFKGFDEIKFEKKGKVSVGIVFLIILCMLNILTFNYTGFIINNNDPYKFNILTRILGTLTEALLFVVANWSVTTLINGSGKLKEIFMVNMYASYARLYLNVVFIILSNVLTLEEMSMAYFFTSLAMVIYCFYTFIGLIVIHEFTFTKGIASIFLTFIAMAIILFIVLLLATMANEVINFFITVYKEIILHYS
jgi:hypothetical protein